MREVAKIPEDQKVVREVQDYLYPKALVRSRSMVIFPSNGQLWVGKVFIARWSGPRETHDVLKYHLDQFLEKKVRIKMPFWVVKEYKLFTDPYVGVRVFSQYEEDSIALCPVFPQYKFVVYYDKKYDVADLKIMRTGSLGVNVTEDVLEYFKQKKLK